MTVDEAMIYAKGRIKHYEDVAELFKDDKAQRAYYQKNAEMLTTLRDEVARLQHELLVAVARGAHEYS